MEIRVGVQVTGEHINYILCRYYLKNGKFPKPLNGMYKAIREYVAVNGAPTDERMEACKEGKPNLYSQANELTERYFPYSFD